MHQSQLKYIKIAFQITFGVLKWIPLMSSSIGSKVKLLEIFIFPHGFHKPLRSWRALQPFDLEAFFAQDVMVGGCPREAPTLLLWLPLWGRILVIHLDGLDALSSFSGKACGQEEAATCSSLFREKLPYLVGSFHFMEVPPLY